jgi:hypothetical protein
MGKVRPMNLPKGWFKDPDFSTPVSGSSRWISVVPVMRLVITSSNYIHRTATE